jgi:flagellar biosynthetic protein FlhB
MAEDLGDRIHPATPARRQQARRDGESAKSLELVAAIQMLGALAIAYLLFGPLAEWMSVITTNFWSVSDVNINSKTSDLVYEIQAMVLGGLAVVAPIFVLLFLLGIASHWIQTGPLFNGGQLAADVGRLSPARWLASLFTWRSLSFPLLGLPKAMLAMAVMIACCWYSRDQFFSIGALPADAMVIAMFCLVLKTCFSVAFTLFAISLCDFGLKYIGFQRRIRMTDQELRDEMRMQNGDPRIITHRREIQQTMRRA